VVCLSRVTSINPHHNRVCYICCWMCVFFFNDPDKKGRVETLKSTRVYVNAAMTCILGSLSGVSANSVEHININNQRRDGLTPAARIVFDWQMSPYLKAREQLRSLIMELGQFRDIRHQMAHDDQNTEAVVSQYKDICRRSFKTIHQLQRTLPPYEYGIRVAELPTEEALDNHARNMMRT
jgi:hypothetical protein